MISPEPPLLTVSRLSKRYGDRWALRDASFEIRKGEILGLIGPNGSGKSTLFATLAASIDATERSVLVSGLEATRADLRRTLFYVPDGIRPWPEQSVDTILRHVATLFRRPSEDVEIAIERLGLSSVRGSSAGTLSKGEHRRMLTALGLLTDTPLLLLDEPFDGLDLRQTRDAMAVLRDHAAAGRTLFLSIHQLADAERMCDRLVLLSDGRVVATGTMAELRARVASESADLEEIFLALA